MPRDRAASAARMARKHVTVIPAVVAALDHPRSRHLGHGVERDIAITLRDGLTMLNELVAKAN